MPTSYASLLWQLNSCVVSEGGLGSPKRGIFPERALATR